MAEVASGGERVREGGAALARGAWDEARAIFERELEARETVEALEGLSWAAWWIEDVPACVEARERAYRLSRRQGDVRRAAMLAVWLGDDYLVLRGERAIANGWFQRAARLLDGLETCPEHGWLDALVGYMAMVEGDSPRARELAVRARAVGRRFAVVALEMFALSVEGVALVNEGEVAGGMRCLDEATAAALAGEFEEIVPAGWTCCMLLNACERVRDYERAAEWCGKVQEFGDRMRINFVRGACRAHYGAVLTWQGRWHEADLATDQADPPRQEMVLGMRYLEAVGRAGALAIVVPPMPGPSIPALLERVDGICLSGGPDLHPDAYGAAPHAELGPTEPRLDAFELALARAADERDMPILAICRGMQVLNVARGGTLHQHLPDVVGETVAHRQPGNPSRPTHGVSVAGDSRLAGILGLTEAHVNSFHHQACAVIGERLTVTARAEDGTVEGFEASDRSFMVGVQWHAECLVDHDEQVALFSALVEACVERALATAPTAFAVADSA